VCGTAKLAHWYLCRACWGQVPAAARRVLNRRDALAVTRLRELHAHIDAHRPLSDLEITP
jgi:hypothetical protein